MNMFDSDIKTCSISFVSLLGVNHLLGSCGFLQVAIEEFAVVIGPESAIFLLPIGGTTNLEGNVSTSAGDHVVYRYEITGMKCAVSQCSRRRCMRMFVCCTELTSKAKWYFSCGK